MTKKRLPRVIARTGEKPREVSEEAARSEQPRQPVRRETAKPQLDEEAAAPRAPKPLEAAEPEPRPIAKPEMTSPPIEGELLPPATAEVESHAVRRRKVAEKVVERYRLYAALGGLSPLPIVNVAGVTAVNMQMAKTLSDLYEVPFQKDLAQSIIAGLMGGVIPTGLGTVAASTLGLIIPGVGFAGVAVASVAAASLTGRIGSVFVERFENAAPPAPASN